MNWMVGVPVQVVAKIKVFTNGREPTLACGHSSVLLRFGAPPCGNQIQHRVVGEELEMERNLGVAEISTIRKVFSEMLES
jgi:hypothetical protein